jgi:P27 family predicted phage terminase small subunit
MARQSIRQGRTVTPPAHLDEAARSKWQQLAATLATSSPGVADALAAYCVAYSRWTAAEAQVAALGLLTKSPAGFPVENPYLGIVKRALIEMHRWGKELGIITRTAKTSTQAAAQASTDNPLGKLRIAR